MNEIILAKKMRESRIKNGLTIKELTKISGMSACEISRVERGQLVHEHSYIRALSFIERSERKELVERQNKIKANERIEALEFFIKKQEDDQDIWRIAKTLREVYLQDQLKEVHILMKFLLRGLK